MLTEDEINNLNIVSSKYIRFEVTENSTKTKEEVLNFALGVIEHMQLRLDGMIAYGDIYDTRDKTITRVVSDKEEFRSESEFNHFITAPIIPIPRVKIVNPFEALILDTQMQVDGEAYAFEFDTATIGQGNYRIEIEFTNEQQ